MLKKSKTVRDKSHGHSSSEKDLHKLKDKTPSELQKELEHIEKKLTEYELNKIHVLQLLSEGGHEAKIKLKKHTIIYDWESGEPNQISVLTGEEVFVLQNPTDSEWTAICKIGWIPQVCVDLNPLSSSQSVSPLPHSLNSSQESPRNHPSTLQPPPPISRDHSSPIPSPRDAPPVPSPRDAPPVPSPRDTPPAIPRTPPPVVPRDPPPPVSRDPPPPVSREPPPPISREPPPPISREPPPPISREPPPPVSREPPPPVSREPPPPISREPPPPATRDPSQTFAPPVSREPPAVPRKPQTVRGPLPSRPTPSLPTGSSSPSLSTSGGSEPIEKPEPGSEVPYDILVNNPPDEINKTKLETYMSDEEFYKIFKMNREEFYKQPQWKIVNAKKRVKLF